MSSHYFRRESPYTKVPYITNETGPFRLLFRFFDSGEVGLLQEGEAALLEKCGYQGRAIVLSAALADLLKWNSETVGLDKLGKAIRLGNNTAVTLYPNAAFSGTPTTIKTDQSCLAQPYAAASIQVQPLAPLLATSPDCPNCALNKADLSNLNLADANLTGAHFAGATLANTNLHGAKLAGADFSEAKLSCADFSGTDAEHREDLTQTTFTNLQILPQSDCRPNFAYTHLAALTLPPAVLRFLNLTSALISGLATNPLSSEQQPLNLSGALLTGAVLDHAILPYADLTQAEMSGASLVHSNLSYAKLHGAALDNSNLESANLRSASLTNHAPDTPQAANLASAFLRNANLSFAQLNGANFTNASFYGSNGVNGQSCPVLNNGEADGCATAHHAVMNNAVFSGAYLFGVDFTNSQATGAVFSNAVLVGANFDHAALGSDSTAATTTSLDSAFLQGANLAGATLDHVSLAGAFVDFNPQGNTMDIRLPGSHTRFPGYWGKSGQEVCAELGYSGPTTVPATNSTITCPDGNKHPNGCGAGDPKATNSPWNNRTDISAASTPASYQENATYTPAAATPICADDALWDVGGNSLRKKRRGGM